MNVPKLRSWRPCNTPYDIPFTPSCTLTTFTIKPYFLYNSNGEPRYVYQSYGFDQYVNFVRCKKSVCYPNYYNGRGPEDVESDDTVPDPRFNPYPYLQGRCYSESRGISLLVWNPNFSNFGLTWETFTFPSCCKCRLSNYWPGLPAALN